MANPILKEDLIGNGVQEALDKMSTTLSTITANLIGLRTAVGESIQPLSQQVSTVQNDSAAVAALEAKLSKYEDTITKLNAALKENNNMQRQVNEAKSKTIELSEYEANKLKTLQDRLKLGAIWQQSVAEGIDTTNMSYNAMKATMNSLLATLRSFDTDSKKNSTAAMALESAVERLRDAMKELDGNTKAVANAEKQMAEESKKAAKEAADAAKEEEKAYKESQKEAEKRVKTQEKLHDARQKEIEDAFKARDAEQQRLKLNDQEFAALNQLKAALASEGQARMDAVQGIDIQKMSYNELYQTYNAIKDALNKMTVAERTGTEEGKALTAQSLKIRDTLNELQKSTGNYTLQVGKYRAAFDGLGYSMQQILREAPSALNLNQFFLAISNNIPMFLDQLKAFKQEQAEIAENLKEMTEGTKEYAEQQAKQMSVGKKLLTSILNWQTAVLVVLMILRNLPKIAEWIKKISTKIKETTTYLTELRSAIISINKSVFDSLAAVNVELDEILRRLPNINTGTKEWADNVGRISELTNGLVDANEQNLESIKNTTEEYKKQAEQLAKNKFAVEFIAENVKKQYLVELFSNAGSAEEAARILGITKDQEKEFAAVQEQFQRRVIRNGKTIVNPKIVYADDRQESEWDQQRRRYNYAASFLGLNTQDTIDSVWARYYKAMKTQKESGGNIAKERSFDFSPSEVNDEYWKAEQARIRMMEQGYDMEIDLQKVKHEEMLEQNDIWQGKREEQLMDNLMGELNLLTDGNDKAAEAMFNAIVKNDTEAISQMSAGAQQLATKYWSDVEEGQRQHDLIMQGLILDNNEAIKAINMKYDKERMDEIDKQYKKELVVVQRRTRTITDERHHNEGLIQNMQTLKAEMEDLTSQTYKDADSMKVAQEKAEALRKEIEKLQSQMKFEKQMSNYKNVWDIFDRNGAFSAGPNMKMGIVASILGEEQVGHMNPDQIDSAFETWLDNLGSSISTWYNTTMGYINDLIGAYVDLANAKAEAAKEATEAAQEEYEKEKALLEAGYASRVEATWAEYQEKKAAQEQAEKDAKAAAEAQQQLNEISTLGSLVTASANIWKTFTEIPVVGVPLAIAAIGTMFGSFLAAKMKAAQVSQYGEGGFEVLEGGSHASGHDINLGVRNRRGRIMHVEGKEGIGIFRIAAMQHYGADGIENVVNGINHLEYEQSVGRTLSLQRDMGLHNTMILQRTNLHRLESGVDKLVAYGSKSRSVEADGTIVEYRKNARITYKHA